MAVRQSLQPQTPGKSFMPLRANAISARACLASLATVGFVVLTATSALAADAAKGETLARRWCAPCHVVAKDQKQPTAEATPFAAIGKRPKFDAGYVALYLLAPHPRMPDMSLSRTEAQDLAAYIASLSH
jgi:mono/diheme cytochrome c family protein